MSERKKPGPRTRLSAEKRERFLEVLSQTGNRCFAAEAIGVDPRLMDQRREFDPLLDRQWLDALDQADRRLAGASGPLDTSGNNVIRRCAGGKLKLVRAGPKRWSRDVEERFFALVGATNNISASARAVGFSPSCIAQRRSKFADFARRLEEALEEAELEVEFEMAAELRRLERFRGRVDGDSHFPQGGAHPGSAARESDCPGAARESDCPSRPFDMDSAMRFLKWREEKRRGGGRRGRVPAPPSIDAVTEKIVRQVEAIKRHRAKKAGGDSH